jgi:hypothetical protein
MVAEVEVVSAGGAEVIVMSGGSVGEGAVAQPLGTLSLSRW